MRHSLILSGKGSKSMGQGGFSEVWLIRHEKTGVHRILKFCFEADRLRSLKREVILFRLLKQNLGDRPDIYKVLDWNFEQAPFYIESEYTEGGSLSEWAQRQGGLEKIPFPVRLDIIAQIATALAAAHSVGLIHKDIKPGNILIAGNDPNKPQIVLADFGVGMVSDAEVFNGQNITVTHMTQFVAHETSASLTGTRIYMAPELLEGKAPTIQADIYAVGVMLYQMILGSFNRAVGIGWRRDVEDGLLAEDLAACLDHDPAHRLTSATDLAERLNHLEERRRKIAEEEQVKKQAEQAQKQAEQAKIKLSKARHMRRLLAGATAILSVVIVAISWFALKARQANEQLEYNLYTREIPRIQEIIAKENNDLAKESLLRQKDRFRNWEWGYLLSECYPELISIRLPGKGSAGSYQTGYSATGRYIITRWDNEMRVLDARTIQPVFTTNDSEALITFAFTPDDQYLITVHADGKTSVWDVASWAKIAMFDWGPSAQLEMSPSGSHILYYRWPYKDIIEIYEVIPGPPFELRKTFSTPILRSSLATALSPDGSLLAVCPNTSNSAWLYDLNTGDVKMTFPFENFNETQYCSVRFSPDGSTLAVSSNDRNLNLWSVKTGKRIAQFRDPDDSLEYIKYSPSGNRILTCNKSKGNARIWDIRTGETVMLAGADELSVGLFSSDGHHVLIRSYQGSLMKLWDSHTGKELDSFKQERTNLRSGFSPDGNYILGNSSQTHFFIRDAQPETRKVQYFIQETQPTALFFSPDGQKAAYATRLHEIVLVDVATGNESPLKLKGHTGTVTELDFSPDRSRIVSASADGSTRLWDVNTGAELLILKKEKSWNARFTKDGTRIVLVSEDGQAEVLATLPWDGVGHSTADVWALDTQVDEIKREKYSEWVRAQENKKPGKPDPDVLRIVKETFERPPCAPQPISQALASKWLEATVETTIAYDRGSMVKFIKRAKKITPRSGFTYPRYRMLTQAMEMMKDAYGEFHPKVFAAYSELGDRISQNFSFFEPWMAYTLLILAEMNPDGALPSNHPNAPKPPPLPSTPPPPPKVLGAWNFDRGDLSSVTGPDLRYYDPNHTGQSKVKTKFGFSQDFGIPAIGEENSVVMRCPPYRSDEGIELHLDFEPNGGGCFLNQYTLIMDVYTLREEGWPVIQTYHENSNTHEIDGPKTGEWSRLIAVMDLTAEITESFGTIFQNGKEWVFFKDGFLTNGRMIDGPFAIRPIDLLFTSCDSDASTHPLYVASLQVRNYAMSESEVKALGKPSPNGIPLTIEIPPSPTPKPPTVEKIMEQILYLKGIYRQVNPEILFPAIDSKINELKALAGADYEKVYGAWHLFTDMVDAGNDHKYLRLWNEDPVEYLPPEHPNARNPKRKPPPGQPPPPPKVLGLWNFDRGDLSANIGQDLEYHDPKKTGMSKEKVRFGTTRSFGISSIAGEEADVLQYKTFRLDEGLEMRTDFAPNGGGYYLNQYTLIMDVFLEEGSNPQFRNILQTYHTTRAWAELYMKHQSLGVDWQDEGYNIDFGKWTRIAFVVDLALPIGQRNGFLYINGKRVGELALESPNQPIDCRFSLRPISLLFTGDENNRGFTEKDISYVSSIQVRNYPMNEEEMEALGGPTAEGISPDIRYDLNPNIQRPSDESASAIR